MVTSMDVDNKEESYGDCSFIVVDFNSSLYSIFQVTFTCLIYL